MKRFASLVTNLTLIIIVFSFLALPFNSVLAVTSKELEDQIIKKQNELNQLNENLKSIENEVNKNKSQKDSSSSELNKVKDEITLMESQAKLNSLLQKQMEGEIEIRMLEKQEKEEEQNEKISSAYLAWKANPNFATKIFINSGETGIVKTTMYYNIINQNINGGIKSLAKDIDGLEEASTAFETNLIKITADMKALSERKAFLEEQMNNINIALERANKNSDGVRSKLVDISQQIDQLSNEQQAIKDKENEQTGGNEDPTPNITPPPAGPPITGGYFYFSGTGRDLYQGHGVGLSQFGAYGAAKKGWNADRIVTFYYSNTSVEVRTGHTITPSGYSTMSADDYVAGLGEVPSRACGTISQIDAWNTFANSQQWSADDPKRNKYVVDNTTTVWDCWPEEAIKAQVIAARSYGVTSSQPICTSASCQVYVGGKAKAWAAWETSNKYIVSHGSTANGQIIRAFYSSDNNQGYGTADNDTVWSGFDGNGSAYSYLRSVNDSSVAYNYTYTNWAWNTNSYTYSNIDSFLTYGANNYTSGGANGYLKSLKTKVGTVQSITFVRDGSNRIKKINFHGTNGTGVMAGWLFKAVWNDWVTNTKPDGQRDYIYSLTLWQKQN